MKKKALTMLLALSMTATMFAGCGSTEEDVDAPSDAGTDAGNEDDANAGNEDDANAGDEQGEAPADDGEAAEIVVGLMCFSPVDSASHQPPVQLVV